MFITLQPSLQLNLSLELNLEVLLSRTRHNIPTEIYTIYTEKNGCPKFLYAFQCKYLPLLQQYDMHFEVHPLLLLEIK